MVNFTVYGKAAPAGSKRAFQHRHTGRIVVTDASKGSSDWKKHVATVAGEAMGSAELAAGPLVVEMTFYVERPKSHYGAKGLKPKAPVLPIVRPDLLKLARGVEDACTGVVWRDDAQIITETLAKRYTDNSARAEIRVVELATN